MSRISEQATEDREQTDSLDTWTDVTCSRAFGVPAGKPALPVDTDKLAGLLESMCEYAEKQADPGVAMLDHHFAIQAKPADLIASAPRRARKAS